MREFPQVFPPLNDLFIEWVYVLDLDYEVFSVNNIADFALPKIPERWVSGMQHASLDIPAPDLSNGATEYDHLSCKIVEPKTEAHLSSTRYQAPLIVALAYLRLSAKLGDSAARASPVWRPGDFLFKELCLAILCLASMSPESLSLETVRHDCDHPGYGLLGFVKKAEIERKVELVSGFARGFHLPHTSPGSAPTHDSYMFHDVLVVLFENLGTLQSIKAGVSRCIHQGRERGLDSFHGVVISMDHLVLLQVFPDGHVEHTKSLPLREEPVNIQRAREREEGFRDPEEDEYEGDVGEGNENDIRDRPLADTDDTDQCVQGRIEDPVPPTPDDHFLCDRGSILKAFLGLCNLIEAGNLAK